MSVIKSKECWPNWYYIQFYFAGSWRQQYPCSV